MAEAEKAKQERIERENQEELERRKKEEEERAREHLDEATRQSQEDEAAWDAWVESQKNQDAGRGPPTLHVGGTTFTWSGHPQSNVRAPPEPTAQEQAVQDILEENERTTQEMIDNRKVAMAVQRIVEQQIATLRGVIEGTIDFGPDTYHANKTELEKLKIERGNAQHIYRAAYDACILETKSDPKYNETRIDHRRGHAAGPSRSYNVWKDWLAEPHCRNVANNTAGSNAAQYADRIRTCLLYTSPSPRD